MIKLEVEHSQLEYKYKMYKSLVGGIGIPSVYCFGMEREYNVLVLEHLGLSLESHRYYLFHKTLTNAT